MAKSNLTYSGNVKITTVKKIRSIKNNGTKEFFKLLCRFLAGYPTNSAELPTFIDLKASQEGATSVPAIIQPVKVQVTYKTSKDGNPVTLYTANIADTNLIQLTTNYSKYTVQLKDGTPQSTLLAEINITDEIIREITTGRQALVEWEVTIANSSATVSNTRGGI